jgi:hypothetical protein
MDIPTRAQYDDAIRQAAHFLKVTDLDLRNGSVMQVEFAAGAVSRPWAMEGGFAIVYRFRTESGKLRALRCFTKAMPTDIQWRYELVGPYLLSNIPDLTVQVHYHDPGIAVRVAEYPVSRFERYPLIEMEWVDGETLLERLDKLCRARDRAALDTLVDSWRTLVHNLKRARIGHGDIAGNNVMVRPDGRLVLVDYDFIYIPAFAGHTVTLGFQEEYQHREAAQRVFGEQMDDFSHMVVYTALVALANRPEFWDAYGPQGRVRAGTERGMLFTREDFLEPGDSPLFADLMQIPQLAEVARALFKASRGTITQVELYAPLADPLFAAKHALLEAIRTDDDQSIVRADVPSLNGSIRLDKKDEVRRQLAHRRLEALEIFRKAVLRNDDDAIDKAYDPLLLDGYAPIKPAWRLRLELTHKRQKDVLACLAAVASEDDTAIVGAC